MNGILKAINTFSKINITAAALGLAVIFSAPSITAQSTLQSTGGGVQPQTNQTQNSVNTQNQVGGVQNNNGQSVLNQNSTQPLGVVSNPNQTAPQAVTPVSNTLKTDITNREDNSNLPWILLLTAALVFTAFCILRRNKTTDAKDKTAKLPVEAPAVRPEPIKVPRKKKQTKKKRKKSAQK